MEGYVSHEIDSKGMHTAEVVSDRLLYIGLDTVGYTRVLEVDSSISTKLRLQYNQYNSIKGLAKIVLSLSGISFAIYLYIFVKFLYSHICVDLKLFRATEQFLGVQIWPIYSILTLCGKLVTSW